jgi:Apea-like HEPN
LRTIDLEQGLGGWAIREIAAAIGPCPWVCEIKVLGHTDGRSRQKALLAARIALSAISLAWQTPSQQAARNGTGLVYELGPAHSRDTVTFQNGSLALASHQSVLRLGRFLTMGDSAAFAASTGRRLETVGVALDTFLSTNPSGPKVLLEEALCRSLIWFGEACNEPLDFMAIVKFGAALDALANGKGAHGICELVQRRCAVSDIDASFLTDGTSAKRLVEEIYNKGRSQIVHGTRSSLIDDLEELRARAELLAAHVLRASIHWLDTYAGIGDVNAFATQA